MRIGENEKIVLSLLKKYPKSSKTSLQLLFYVATGRKARIDSILFSLKVKGILDEKTGKIDYAQTHIDEEPMAIDKSIIDNLGSLSEPIKIGNIAKTMLYALTKTDKSSIQFFAVMFNEKEGNIYAILKRLEEKNLVASYVSRMRHQNRSGKRFNPKYYVITDFGKLWIMTHFDDKKAMQRIDGLLKDTERKHPSLQNLGSLKHHVMFGCIKALVICDLMSVF